MEWQPIEAARKDKPILICGGVYDWDTGYGDEVPFDGVAIVQWVPGTKSGWRGENCGAHDEYFWFKPKWWMPLPEPPAA